MKKIFKICLILIVLGLLYTYRDVLKVHFMPLWYNIQNQFFAKALCLEPIPYTLGTFDNEFNISKKYFLNTLTEAEAIWEKPSGMDLFVYAPNDSGNILKVNLVYDYRQQATSKLASLGIVVKDSRASYDMLKAKFTALRIEYEKEKSYLNSQVQAFNKKQLAYETEVNFWNKKGGAREDEYNKLQATGLELKNESKQLQILQKNLSEKTDEINAFVVVLNRLVTSLNLSVEKYNTTNESRGESFEEGVYTIDGSNKEIDIYEFSSREKLVRVLAHELGHALGLEHVNDTKAIMYEKNQGDTEALTETDINALKTECGL